MIILKFNSRFIQILCGGLLLIFSYLRFIYLFFFEGRIYFEYSLFSIGGVYYKFLILIDQVRLLFRWSVTIISLRVIIFSWEYMLNDKTYKGFHLLVIIFVLRIILLIFSPRLLRGIIGWDGLGLSSYLLVIYYASEKSFNSGIITVLTNRLGDALLLIAIAFLVEISDWRLKILCNSFIFENWLVFLLIIIGCSTKRAQLPFCAWLPAAIAAPTPVSSLVHSSTLVTAGVYLLLRHEYYFFNLGLSNIILYLGLSTIILSRVRALYEYDIKKIVALSTLRQLGVIVTALGIGLRYIRFFHLLGHAFFKALLFICTGRIIHRSNNYQDIRVMGGVSYAKPITSSFILLSVFRLGGIPFISAFFSKEIILESFLRINYGLLEYRVFILGAILTIVYRIRFGWFVYWGYTKKERLSFIEDRRIFSGIRIIILILPALWGGWLLKKHLFPSFVIFNSSINFKLLLLIGLLLSFLISWRLRQAKITKWRKVNSRLRRILIIPFFSSQIFTHHIPKFGVPLLSLSDQGVTALFSRKLLIQNFWEFNEFKSSLGSQSKVLFILFCWLLLRIGFFYWCIKIIGDIIVNKAK